MAKYRCKKCGAASESERCFRHKLKKPLKNTGTIPRIKKYIEKENEMYNEEKMWALFCKLWKERGPYSEIDDSYLGKEPKTVFFDHLLPKETFPEVMYESWNILICTWEQHDQKHNGVPHPKHQEAIKRAKEVYNNLFSNY